MKRWLVVLLSVCLTGSMAGCGAKEQSATYVYVQEEEGMFTMTDTQRLQAKGDKVQQLLETTVLEFTDLNEETLGLLVEYYDETVNSMKDGAPEGVEVTSSYDGAAYTMEINMDLTIADLQELIDGGYLMGLDDSNPEEFTFVSFEKTCAGLEASGYTAQ